MSCGTANRHDQSSHTLQPREFVRIVAHQATLSGQGWDPHCVSSGSLGAVCVFCVACLLACLFVCLFVCRLCGSDSTVLVGGTGSMPAAARQLQAATRRFWCTGIVKQLADFFELRASTGAKE